MKKIAFLLVALVALVSCGQEHQKPSDVTSFEIKNSSIQLLPGASVRISYSPSDAQIEWTSANPAVATVDARGSVVGVAEGKTKITGKLKTADFSASIDVEVLNLTDYITSTTVFNTVAPVSSSKMYACNLKDSTGAPYSITLSNNKTYVVDSLVQIEYLMLNSNMYFDGTGALAGEGGLCMNYVASCAQVWDEDDQKFYWVPFAYFQSVENAYIKKDSTDALLPYTIQASNFKEDEWLNFWTAVIVDNDESASLSDYDYIDKLGAEFYYYYINEETGKLGGLPYAFLMPGSVFRINVDDNNNWLTDTYILNVELFGGSPYDLGLATETTTDENGETQTTYKVPLELATMVQHKFTLNEDQITGGGEEAPRALPMASLHKQIKVFNALNQAFNVATNDKLVNKK